MKPTFHHRLVNSQYEDPCLFVRLLRERRAFLFDAGHIDRLSSGDLLKVTDVFVTHMHIDHFVGFDTILRALLRRETPLRVYGPSGIIECVEGKLKGYTWNLIEEYPLKLEVFGITDQEISHSSFHAENRFERIDRGVAAFRGIAFQEPPFSVKAAALSHGIPCLGYALEEDYHININKVALHSMGLPVGAWLSELKRMIRDQVSHDTPLTINGKEFLLSELVPVATVTSGQKVSYITDISPEDTNLNKVVELVKDSDTLYCEAYFLHKDLERAFERHHLTAKLTGAIARKSGVRNLVLMHFSPKYFDNPDAIETEAMGEYNTPQEYAH